MARVFTGLALFAIALLVVNIVLGFRTGNYNEVARQYVAASQELHEFEQSESATAEQIRDKKARRFEIGEELETPRQNTVLHILFGIAAALVTLLVNSITVTYFIGTSRWCKEVVDTYGLDEELANSSIRLKRKAFPWAVGGIVILLAILFLGGAALPFGANAENAINWVVPHYLGAIGGTALIGWSLLVQVGYISENFIVINKILEQVRRVREERGLDAPQKAEATT